MEIVGLFTGFAVIVFAVVLLGTVESWFARIILGGIVAGLGYFLGETALLVSAAVFAIILLIRHQIPTISRL